MLLELVLLLPLASAASQVPLLLSTPAINVQQLRCLASNHSMAANQGWTSHPIPAATKNSQVLPPGHPSTAMSSNVSCPLTQQWCYSGADLQLACRDASMMPMRRMVEGKSPTEIIELQASGQLEGEVNNDDFAAALSRTQPSTAGHEHRLYEAWNDEYGCK